MKIVINKCYGGFSLSPEGVKEFFGRKGKKVYFYGYETATGFSVTPINIEDGYDAVWHAYSIDNVHLLPTGKADHFYLDHRNIDRTDPDLIEMIEADADLYSGSCAKLRVIEIPDGIEYTIEEYDGIEHVAEVHRVWY